MEHLDNPPSLDSIEDDEAGTFELQQELQAVHDEAKRFKTELAALNKRMARRQKEIAARQKRFDAMPGNKKKAGRAEFEDAVHWRNREIDLIQVQIKALEAQAVIARGSARGVALHLEPPGIGTGPRAGRRSGLQLSPRQREIRARARATRLDHRMQNQRARLEAERNRGVPAKADLEAAAAVAEKEVARIAAIVEQTKAQIKKRKRELSDWKLWYGNLPETDKPAGKTALDREIKWRADEISDLQTRLGTLESKSLTAMGELEQARIQIEALQAGAYARPLDDDPRLTHVRLECETAAHELATARKSAGHPRRTQSAAQSKRPKVRTGPRRQSPQKRRRKK